ncbi:MAG: DegT/DnrJ/EryC1/StrS family aminotransferase [Candidatus Omnitrophota bacterium]|nr:MAG: DegT/DnrJ/EryC1/StrS family aminotransferase [Candidatus Omnitrophota bacterium]
MREIPFGRPMLGEEEKKAVMEVLNGPILVHGPKAKEFESAFAGYVRAPNAVTVSSCTAALHLSYFYLDIGEGDEVIVPAQTHTAAAHAVELCGARPVFVDAEKDTGNIDIEQIEPAISDRTKAISIVHYLGMPVYMDKVLNIAKKHNLFVVEDCALAIGTYFKKVHAGLFGDTGCFSFYPVKHMTTAEGGMLITRHKEVAEKICRQKAFGVDRHVGERKIPGVYDVNMLGFNYRLNEIQAALGIEQVKRMNGFLKKRKENYEILSRGLGAIDGIRQFKSTHGDYQSSYYCLSILLNEQLTSKRFEIIQSLKQKGVGTSVYYPQAVPHFTYYKNKYKYDDNSFPVASWISRSSIALPVGPHLDVEDMEYIAESVKDALMEVK